MTLSLKFQNVVGFLLRPLTTQQKPEIIYDKLTPDRILVSKLSTSIFPAQLSNKQIDARAERLFGYCQQSGDYTTMEGLLLRCQSRGLFTKELVEDDYLWKESSQLPWRGLERLCEIGFVQKRALSQTELATYNLERLLRGLSSVTRKDIYWVANHANL